MIQQGTGELAWYALRTLPQREDMAAKLLRYDGLVAEVKTERKLRRRTKWDKERRYINYTAAPGYIWLAVPAHEDPRVYVRPFHIFRSFVGYNGRPLRLPEIEMARFLNFQPGEAPGYFRYHKTGREFKIGQTVIVNTGPFRDHQVRVENIHEGEAFFFVRMLGKDQEVRISVNDCIPMEEAA